MPRTKTTVTDAVGEYLARHSRQDDVLARVEAETAERAELSYAAGSLLNRMGDYAGARHAHGAALAIWKQAGDRRRAFREAARRLA